MCLLLGSSPFPVDRHHGAHGDHHPVCLSLCSPCSLWFISEAPGRGVAPHKAQRTQRCSFFQGQSWESPQGVKSCCMVAPHPACSGVRPDVIAAEWPVGRGSNRHGSPGGSPYRCGFDSIVCVRISLVKRNAVTWKAWRPALCLLAPCLLSRHTVTMRLRMQVPPKEGHPREGRAPASPKLLRGSSLVLLERHHSDHGNHHPICLSLCSPCPLWFIPEASVPGIAPQPWGILGATNCKLFR